MDRLVATCEKVAKDIRNRYTVGYSPKNITLDDKVRKLRVTAVHPEAGRRLEVRTRTHYTASSRG